MSYRITLILDPQPEGGYTVTCQELPELITQGDSVDEARDLIVCGGTQIPTIQPLSLILDAKTSKLAQCGV